MLFVDSDLTDINDDDCAIYPRVLPLSYISTIRKSAHDLTLFALRLLSLPEREVRAIIPHGPIRDFLIDHLQVLRYRPHRLTGSFRFDMAIVGKPEKGNPPKLFELNEIGFGGLARSTHIEETLFRLMPELKKHLVALPAASLELANMRRLGKSIVRIQAGTYDWEEEVLIQKAKSMGIDLRLVSPASYGFGEDLDAAPLLPELPTHMSGARFVVGRKFQPDAVQFGFSFELKDYLQDEKLYKNLVRSKTPLYGPFITGLVASKMILVLLSDATLRRRLLGSARALEDVILPAAPLPEKREALLKDTHSYVLKHVDGLGGELVFMGNEIPPRLKRISKRDREHWIIQQRTKMNVIKVNGILSRPRRVISDLGVFVQYDWAQGKFRHFGLGGFISRATNKSYRVNVSGGGIQVPVMFAR